MPLIRTPNRDSKVDTDKSSKALSYTYLAKKNQMWFSRLKITRKKQSQDIQGLRVAPLLTGAEHYFLTTHASHIHSNAPRFHTPIPTLNPRQPPHGLHCQLHALNDPSFPLPLPQTTATPTFRAPHTHTIKIHWSAAPQMPPPPLTNSTPHHHHHKKLHCKHQRNLPPKTPTKLGHSLFGIHRAFLPDPSSGYLSDSDRLPIGSSFTLSLCNSRSGYGYGGGGLWLNWRPWLWRNSTPPFTPCLLHLSQLGQALHLGFSKIPPRAWVLRFSCTIGRWIKVLDPPWRTKVGFFQQS